MVNHNKLSQYCARFARLFTKCEHLGRKIHDPLLNVITFNVWRGCNDRENFHRYREIPRGKAYVEPLRASRVTSLLDSFDSFLSCALISLSLSRTFFFLLETNIREASTVFKSIKGKRYEGNIFLFFFTMFGKTKVCCYGQNKLKQV